MLEVTHRYVSRSSRINASGVVDLIFRNVNRIHTATELDFHQHFVAVGRGPKLPAKLENVCNAGWSVNRIPQKSRQMNRVGF
jgi:hypothetical protein